MTRLPRLLAAIGASYAAIAVGLGAYAAHAAELLARERLQTAALYLALHGIALVALRLQLERLPLQVAAGLLALGTLLFAGSLVGAALLGWPTRLAPVGGVTMIIGWLLLAVAVLRDR